MKKLLITVLIMGNIVLPSLFAQTIDLPKVLIIGDSISIGYTANVRKLLDGKADVFRPNANCQHSANGVKCIGKWIDNKKWDVIHFNFGLWDTHYLYNGQFVRDPSKYKEKDLKRRYTTTQYVKNLKKIVDALKKTDAKLIWASTTPFVSYGEDTKILVVKNNKAAEKLMKKSKISINDLYALAFSNLKEWQLKDGCHYNKKGYEQLAKQVASTISSALTKKAKDSKSATGH